MNFTGALHANTARHPDKTAVIWNDLELGYSDLLARTNRFGNSLKKLGVKPGDRVGLSINNRPEFVIAYYAAAKIGAIVVPMNYLLRSTELKHILNDSGCSIFVAIGLSANEFVDAREEMPKVGRLITVDEYEGAESMPELMERESDSLDIVERDPEDVAVIKYTSGTTGAPKGVMLTQRNVCLHNETLAEINDFSEQDRLLVFLPLFHGFGDMCQMNPTFHTGNGIVLQDPFHPEEIFRAIAQYRITAFGAVPSMLYALVYHPMADECDLSSLKFVYSGGQSVPLEQIRRFEEKFGVKILEGYGLTEGTASSTFNRPDRVRKPGSVGVPYPGLEIRIVDDGGADVPQGEPGEVIQRSPLNMKGYWNNPEATAETLRDGWLHTGDIGRLDEDGYLYIVDRKKEMIIMSGENIYPREVEEVIYTHPEVLEAAVVGVPDERRGEIPKALVVLKPDSKLTEEDFLQFCKSKMAFFKVPKLVEFRDSLPKGPTGKVLKRALK